MEHPVEAELCESVCVHPEAVELAADGLPPEEEMADMAELFKVFGDSTRIKILCLLSRCELCVCDIAELLKMTQPAISYQLRVLKNARLVKNRREGKTIFYFLADSHVETIIGMAKEHLEE
ncbi:MAG: metalloregulator ArsR/SmtB family transcription factor [Oscillospiraceae bacterium]|nr:metalloregulator ArsR/SmtB family transcription factor [Oscillospiraceae bacterium]